MYMSSVCLRNNSFFSLTSSKSWTMRSSALGPRLSRSLLSRPASSLSLSLFSHTSRIVFSRSTPCRSSSNCLTSMSNSSILTAFRGNFFTCLLGGVGRAGAGPFFFFHWPSRLALLGLMGVNRVTTHDAGMVAETEVVPTSASTPLVGGGAGGAGASTLMDSSKICERRLRLSSSF